MKRLVAALQTYLAIRKRDDYTSRFITCVTSGSTPMAAVDWDAATASLASGSLPCSAVLTELKPGT